MVKVIDDFIDQELFGPMQEVVCGDWQSWYYQSNIVGDFWGETSLGKHGFNCWIVQQTNTFIDNYASGLLSPLFNKMVPFAGCTNILKSRLDMTVYGATDNQCHAHVDDVIPHLATIFYFNDSDGDTVIYNEKFDKEKYMKNHEIPKDLTVQKSVSPKANRLLIFDGAYVHTGHTPREHNNRIILNSNLN